MSWLVLLSLLFWSKCEFLSLRTADGGRAVGGQAFFIQFGAFGWRVLFYGTLWSAAAYARCYDYADTINMIRTWLLSLGASWLIIEPLSALFLVGMPATVGRWCERLEEMGFDPAMFF